MVRFACSGTEATMHALRVARAYTGRELVIKFEGNYHGFQDYTLWSTYAPVEAYGSPRNPIPVAASSGIPKPLNSLIITLPFNDFDAVERTFKSYGYQVAALISEPCQGNCSSILPEAGFLEFLRKKCDEYGVVFILDEVKTGFRIANGGAQEYYNLKPDLATYAKALGNGYPLAAFGGKKEIMSIIGQGVAQGGTYNNNKPGVAAAWATLTILEREPVMETLNKRGQRLIDGISQILREAGIVHALNGYPAMFSFAIGKDKTSNQRAWSATDKDFYLKIMDGLIERGVMPDYDPREPWFLCYAHSDKDIDDTLMAFCDTIKALK
jgi:glutamate-1-semialdehyde 2,1-aminomutase